MARTALRGRLIDIVGDPTHSASAVRVVDDGLLLIDDGHIVARGEYGSVAGTLVPWAPAGSLVTVDVEV